MLKKLHLISVLTISLVLASCSEERESFTVEKSDLVESVYSSVILEPEGMYRVNSSVAGYIDEIPYKVGDKVLPGDVLFRIRDVQSASVTSNARLAYDLAQKNYSGDRSLLDDLKLEIDNAALKRKNDSVNYERNKALYDNGALTKFELEQSELMFTSSKSAHVSLSNRLRRTERELKSALSQAKNNYESSLSRSEDAVIRNKVDGKLYDLLKEPGEFVMMQEPIAVVGSSSDFTVKMLIDEVDITQVELGQKIMISLEAYNGEVFEAKVTHISPKMDERTQTFEIEGKFTKAPKSLFMGLTGEGNIVIKERKNTVVIPREYILEDSKVETDAGEVEVKLGARSLSHVEILSGLKEGDVIYKPAK
jgi:RND family efflux transporter MFP subunit